MLHVHGVVHRLRKTTCNPLRGAKQPIQTFERKNGL